MKYNDTIEILKTIAKTINDPTIILDKLGKTEFFQFPNNNNSNNNINLNIYAEPENNNIEYNKSASVKNNKSYEDSILYNNNDYYKMNNQQDTPPTSQGVLDSITQELTSVRLQQAIILSEIVAKPRSKTRKRRRF
ncbi:hypothetical protein CLPUN_40760 [Clostridium puniceum]|uniref:Uncharacterized protein n=1 Tax=Clostridium puniceum TaxID=29367 RepID=A0A1S8T9C4_9CLOT|nr:hypothetical protein [Clostridium puniceum]OOM74194.1 hypothetical protein CLPUN_40760 [Clostridium puniceum]